MARFSRHGILAVALLTAAVGIGGSQLLRAADPPAAQPNINADLDVAIKLLGASPDTKAADEAVAKLQAAMVEQSRQVIAAQKLLLQVQTSLAHQLSALTGLKDAESQARVAGLLDFNSAIYTWASNAAALDPQQRDAVLDWGLKTDNLPLIAKIYGHDPDAKAQAIHDLAKQDPSTATDFMFQVLLNDKDREISLLTLDALFDRKPSSALIDTLCDHAFGWVLNQGRAQPQRQHIVMVHGRQMSFFDSPNQNNYSQQDAEIYADLLTQYHDPKIGEKFDAMLKDYAAAMTNINDGRVLQIISPNYSGNQMFRKLTEEYKPKSMAALCVKVLQNQSTNSQDTQMSFNGVVGQYHMSTHCDAIAMLALATSQDPSDYGLVKMDNYQGRWMVPGNANDENDSLKKMHDWVEKHAKDIGIESAGAFPPASVPPNAPARGGFRGGGFGGAGMP